MSKIREILEVLYKEGIENGLKARFIELEHKMKIEKEISARKEEWKKELLEKLPKERTEKHLAHEINGVRDEVWDAGWNSCLSKIKKLIEEV